MNDPDVMVRWLLSRPGWKRMEDGWFRFLTERGLMLVSHEDIGTLYVQSRRRPELFAAAVLGFEIEACECFRTSPDLT